MWKFNGSYYYDVMNISGSVKDIKGQQILMFYHLKNQALCEYCTLVSKLKHC